MKAARISGVWVIEFGSGFKLLGALRSFGRKVARQPRGRAFVGWQAFYDAWLGSEPGKALIQHTGPLVGEATAQLDLIDAMGAGGSAAIVWAPPGCGKSRFALELAKSLEKGRDRWQVLFVQHDAAAVREELNELSEQKRVVLIVDDAHECPELVKLLGELSARSAPARSVYLVCLTRTIGRAEIARALNEVFPAGTIRELDLGRPALPHVRSLIDKLLPKSSPMHRDTIARFVRQSYFGAVLVCTLLSKQSKLPQSFQRQDLRDRVCRQPFIEATRDVCPIEVALRALAVYAALTPVAEDNAAVHELAAQLSGLTTERVVSLVERMLAAGLFENDGHRRIRPVPDLLGDLILEEACLDTRGLPTPFSTQLFDHVFELDPRAAVANCAEMGQLFGTPQDVDLISKVMLERARTVARENKRDVVRLLRSSKALTGSRPATVVEIVRILESRNAVRREPPAGELYAADSVEMEACSLLMSAAEADPTAIPVALGLGRDLYLAALEYEPSLLRVRELLEGTSKFQLGRSAAHSRAVVATLRGWSGESTAEVATLGGSLSGQYLRLDVEAPADVSPHRGPLSPAAEIWAVRDIAVDTLVRGMSHADVGVQSGALRAIEHYGHYEIDSAQVALDSWRPQLTREIGALSAAMIKLAKSSSSLPIWARVELQGWLWWTQDLDVLHQAGVTLLEALSNSDAYQLWKSLHARALPIRTAIPASHSADAATRLQYFQNVATVREESADEQARELLETLDPGHADAAAWRKLWLTALEQTPAMALSSNVDAVVAEFARRHSQEAWTFVTESDAHGPLSVILPMLLVELRKQDRSRASEAARDVPAGTRLEEAWLKVLWSARDFDEVESGLLARGLSTADPEMRHRAGAALLQATNIDRAGAFRRVFTTVARHPEDESLWALVIEQFVDQAGDALGSQAAAPSEAMVRVADELITLFQTHSSRLRWGYQRHTRRLSHAFAILAILQPQRLQDWMQRVWGKPGRQWNDESPLGVSRLREIMRLIRQTAATAFWIDVFGQWILRERELGGVAVLGLTELCTLDNPKIAALIEQIGRHPTDAAAKAFAELIQLQKSDRAFAEKALAVLEAWSRFPGSYGPIEDAVVQGLVQGAGGRIRGQPSPVHVRTLEAIEAKTVGGASTELFRASLERASREVREAMDDDVARDEEPAAG